jgi:hypothetical protein
MNDVMILRGRKFSTYAPTRETSIGINKDTLKEIAIGISCVIGILFFIAIGSYGMTKNERVECFAWAEQERMYESFYWSDWQIAQCVSHNLYPHTELK